MKSAAPVPEEVSGLVTSTSFAPAVPDGVVAVMVVELTQFTFVAGTPPTETVAPLKKFAPVMVIDVPPAVEPADGETAETAGGGLIENVRTTLPVCPAWGVRNW